MSAQLLPDESVRRGGSSGEEAAAGLGGERQRSTESKQGRGRPVPPYRERREPAPDFLPLGLAGQVGGGQATVG